MKPFIFVLFLVILSPLNGKAQCGACEYPSGNLVVNGDFEQGDVGFTTDYNYATVNGPWGLLSFEGVYVIGSNANTYHTFFAGFDHTNPPNGLFMIVNGASTPNTNVWCQTIAVTPNTVYSFSAWAQNVDTGPNANYADLQFNINGVALGDNVIVDGGWMQIQEEWFSGDNTVIEICLTNNQTGGGGNDFGIDDISFSTCIPYEVVQIPSAGDDQVICNGDQVTLGQPALANFSYAWQGPNLTGNTNANPTFGPINNTSEPVTYTYTLTTDSAGTGCTQTDQVSVTINPIPQPDLGPTVSICIDETTVLNAGNGWEEVVWDTGEQSTQIEVDEPGTYSVTVTMLGCEGTGSIEVTTPPLPNFNLGDNVSICSDEMHIFSSGGPSGTWSTGEEGNTIEVSTEGWYIFEVENQGCTEADSVYLTVIEYPVIEIENYVEICPGETHTFYTTQTGTWSNGIVGDSMTVAQPGTYSVILNNEQCLTEDVTEVVLLELPFVDLGPDQYLCMPAQVRVNVSGPHNDEVIWSDGSEEFERIITESGLFGVVAINDCGTYEDVFEVEIDDCDYGIYIPNAFTPDGDGLNEVWKPIPLNLEWFRVIVYNRWGEEMWSTETEGEFWNGNYQGGGYYVPDGVYVYKADGMSHQGKPVSERGSIVLIR